MKKIFLGILLGVTVLAISGIVAAAMLIPASERAREKSKADNAPVIERVKEHKEHLVLTTPGLEKIVLIHFAKPTCNNNEICEPELGENPSCADCKNGEEEPESTCYAFLGAKWKDLPVDYVIDPIFSSEKNPNGLPEEFVVSAISTGAEEWDSHTIAELFNDSYEVVSDGSWDSDAPDGRNELLFGDYPQEGVIAVAIVWGYFRGRPSNRRIVEFDIMFDTDWVWGDASINSAVMDLRNIATHELGHGAGLDDLYETACLDETMYGYSGYGEIKKRGLNTGDIIGIQELYGL